MSHVSLLAPYDAFMLVSYGGPNGPEDVLPFLRNATGGTGIPDERLKQVGAHYSMFAGVSPINARNQELLRELRQRLDPDHQVPFVIGNRNWHPYFTQSLLELVEGGARRILTLFTSAYTSYSGCRQYRENLASAMDEVRVLHPEAEVELSKVRAFANTPGFVVANVNAIKAAMSDLGDSGQVPHLVMVTHSIPISMARYSGAQIREQPGADLRPALFESGFLAPGSDLSKRDPDLCEAAVSGLLPVTREQDALGQGWTYLAQHLAVAGAITGQLHEEGIDLPWSLAFCSRSGPPQAKWLEPDINDHLSDLAVKGVRQVIVCPFGFICDHMEVVFDLDTEARQTAAREGLEYRRAATAQADHVFLDQLARVVQERVRVARGENPVLEIAPNTYPAFGETCGKYCCQYVNVHAG